MKRKWDLCRVVCVFFIVSAFFFHAGYSAAADRYYTVQTATFNLSAFSHALKHFDALAKELRVEELDNLRIAQTAKFYVVRLGKFENMVSAQKVLRVVRPLAGDAFILRESNTGDIGVVRTYNGLSAPDEYYTILAGTFGSIEEASLQYEILIKSLITSDLMNLRIEKKAGSFDLKIGRFNDYAASMRFLRGIEPLIPKAIVVKALSGEGQIIRTHTGVAAQQTAETRPVENSGPVTGKETPDDSKPAMPGAVVKAEKVEDLFANISTQYYEQHYDRAAEMLREGINKWPDNADLYAWYGATLLNMKSPDKAYEIYQKAVELSPDVPDYHAGMGYSLLNIYMDRARASIDAFNKALELDPDNVDALEGLGIVYVSIDKKDVAASISAKLRDLNPDASRRLDTMIKRGIDWKK